MTSNNNDFQIRRIATKDFQQVKEALNFLTEVEPLSQEKFDKVLEYWSTYKLPECDSPVYNCFIIVPVNDSGDETGEVAAVGTIFIEQKLIHGGALTGHIEDIAVNAKFQGKKLGKKLINYLSQYGLNNGCYKVILDCEEKNIGFYEKCNFNRHGVEMQIRK